MMRQREGEANSMTTENFGNHEQLGRSLVFALNGRKVELKDVDPRMSLLSYIRDQTDYKGTKYGCGEGGCGACVVLLSKYDPKTKKVDEYTVNSCLALICSIDGCAVTTTEGLKHGKEPHAVHTRMAGFHASQCGYCTPGMAVSIYTSLKNSSSLAPPTVSELQKSIAGNLCRCTGYRPILDVCKSFASDVDIEDLGINTFWTSQDDESIKRSSLNVYLPEKDPQFPKFLQEQDDQPLEMHLVEQSEKRSWKSLRSLKHLLDTHRFERASGRNVHFVVGNTGPCLYKDERPTVYLDISKIPELQSITRTESGVEVGAAISLSKLLGVLQDDNDRGAVFKEIAKHLSQVANEHVRNQASVGGNLMLSKKRGLASDVSTVLLGVGSEVTVATSDASETMALDDFLVRKLDEEHILQSIRIPSWARLSEDNSKTLLFRTYRASQRPSGNATSAINAAFLAIFLSPPDGNQRGSKLQEVRLALGALGCPHAIRATKTEELLRNKIVTVSVLKDAVKILKEEVLASAQDDFLHSAEYRASVAVGFLFRFFEFLITSPGLMGPSVGNGCITGVHEENHSAPNTSFLGNGTGDGTVARNGEPNETKSVTRDGGFKVEVRKYGRQLPSIDRKRVFSGKQVFSVSNEFYPVAQPTGKFAAVLQATGEAVYVGDIPLPLGTLHGAFVSSRKALAKVISVDTSEALSLRGACTFVSVKDIPSNGENIGSRYDMLHLQDKLFAEDTVHYVGQPLGVLIADTHEHAVEAAARVRVNYDVTSLGKPILTLEDAVTKNSFKSSAVAPLCVASFGDTLLKGDYRIENIEVRAGGQYFFYLETQTALAVPDEDDCITVYSSTQSPENLQTLLSIALGLPIHNIRVITRRLGGGFGGKESPSFKVAIACALAALKLKKPVRLTLERDVDMEYCGGRHESEMKFSVEFNKDGKITSLDSQVLMNGGYEEDYSDVLGLFATTALKSYNWSSWRHVAQVCRTNLPTRTMMRAPGAVQGNFFAESVIEHVAAFLGLDPWRVREINMHSHESVTRFYGPQYAGTRESFSLPLTWKKLKDSSRYEARKDSIQKYNETHLWLKRGISLVPMLYTTLQTRRLARVTIFADGSIAVDSGGTEMGQGLFTKVQQATAYGLSRLWGDAGEEKVPLSKIRIVQNDTISLGNAGVTYAGTTSEGTCDAILNACQILVENLKPVLVELQRKSGYLPSWEAVIKSAKQKNIALSAQAQHSEQNLNAAYILYGACCTEVEVEVLTGAVHVLQTDLLYDCGKSLNPAVDIGQIEGAFVQGLGYFVTEQIKWDEYGVLLTNGTGSYKPPSIDIIPHQFNVELLHTNAETNRILSSKSAGEPPLLLAKSAHNAIRAAIRSARKDLEHIKANSHAEDHFLMNSSANMETVRELCGYDNVELYLAWLSKSVEG